MKKKTMTVSASAGPANREARLAALAQQINARENADPQILAAAIERYLLLDLLEIMANPASPPELRAEARSAYFKWRQGDLARQRLALEQAKLAAAQPPSEPPESSDSSPLTAEEQSRLIIDKFDEIMGLKPLGLIPPSADPSPPPAPAPVPVAPGGLHPSG